MGQTGHGAWAKQGMGFLDSSTIRQGLKPTGLLAQVV
jgi:hypothetical protein